MLEIIRRLYTPSESRAGMCDRELRCQAYLREVFLKILLRVYSEPRPVSKMQSGSSPGRCRSSIRVQNNEAIEGETGGLVVFFGPLSSAGLSGFGMF